jgi:hypothetical protein
MHFHILTNVVSTFRNAYSANLRASYDGHRLRLKHSVRDNKNKSQIFKVSLCNGFFSYDLLQTKQTPLPLVRKLTIPTERPPLVGEI